MPFCYHPALGGDPEVRRSYFRIGVRYLPAFAYDLILSREESYLISAMESRRNIALRLY